MPDNGHPNPHTVAGTGAASRTRTRECFAMLRPSLLLLAIASARADYSLDDADRYLESVAVAGRLQPLHVTYSVGGWGRKVRVEGASTQLSAPKDVKERPSVEWDAQNVNGATRHKFVLAMIDPDHPEGVGANLAASGTEGPVMHWLGLNCDESAASCHEAIPYVPPALQPGTGKHRCIFVLFRQRPNQLPDKDVLNSFLGLPSRNNWPFGDFVKKLEGSIEPFAVNFFYASAEGEPAGAKPAAGPAPSAIPLGPGATPLGPPWVESMRPKPEWHDEL